MFQDHLAPFSQKEPVKTPYWNYEKLTKRRNSDHKPIVVASTAANMVLLQKPNSNLGHAVARNGSFEEPIRQGITTTWKRPAATTNRPSNTQFEAAAAIALVLEGSPIWKRKTNQQEKASISGELRI